MELRVKQEAPAPGGLNQEPHRDVHSTQQKSSSPEQMDALTCSQMNISHTLDKLITCLFGLFFWNIKIWEHLLHEANLQYWKYFINLLEFSFFTAFLLLLFVPVPNEGLDL